MFERNPLQRNSNTILSLLPAFLIGGLIGAGIALLMAPQSGQETREMLRDRGVELKEKAKDTAEDTKHRAERVLEETKDRAESLRHRGQEMMQETRDKVESEVQAAKRSASY